MRIERCDVTEKQVQGPGKGDGGIIETKRQRMLVVGDLFALDFRGGNLLMIL